MSKRTKSIAPRPSQIPPAEQKLKFLLIEDESTVVRSVQRQVKQYATILTADTVSRGRTLFLQHQHTIEIIFLDGMLLDGNSLELLAFIRSSGFKGEIISITSNSQLRESLVPSDPSAVRRVDATSHGCDKHIGKTEIASYMIAHINSHSV